MFTETQHEDPEDVKQIETFNLVRSGHLHLSDWSLIVTALENLVIDLEKSEGRLEGNLIDRADGLRSNINNFILECND